MVIFHSADYSWTFSGYNASDSDSDELVGDTWSAHDIAYLSVQQEVS